MNILLTPAIKLMQSLRLLPKFTLVTIVFLVPLLLVSTLLFNELDKSIEFAKQERIGVNYIRQVQELARLTQQHRALRHMALSGNASAKDKAAQKQADINTRFSSLDASHKTAAGMGAHTAWTNINRGWSDLQTKLPTANAKQSYAEHTALIEQMYKLNTLIADRSNLTLDSEVGTYYLATAFVKTLPEIADGLAEIAGRGAAYIDTGLLEANEDVMLNSDVMVARRDLARIPVQMETLFREHPALKAALAAQMPAIPAATEFLDRTKNEVLNAYNQTSGNQFFDAGSTSTDGLYVFANSAAALLDELLQQRIERNSSRRNLIMGGIGMALLIAAYLLAGFYASFSSAMAKLIEAVERTTRGDLSSRFSSRGKDEIAQLLNATGRMNAGLAQLVSEVRTGTEAIATASREIANGNTDLSSRTEEQAASLEETSASLAQLTSTVQQNASHAQQANLLAMSASQVAVKGGAAVAQVITTMESIKQSARRIGDIINVIDGIAFQTNILALNAAVEAARAGGQGKGFAVVAAEVRSLAQRSAAAAKEIKLLIADSSEKVNAGGKQVNETGQTMDEIVASVKQVTAIMRDIAAASEEQRAGIEHVNEAVGCMDQITQQNAALVEQAAAAAQSMQEQTTRLSQAIAVFKLNDAMQSTGQTQSSASAISKNVLSLANREMRRATWRTPPLAAAGTNERRLTKLSA